MPTDDSQPLLQADRRAQRDAENDHIYHHINWLSSGGGEYVHSTRKNVQTFLTSKYGHYSVLLLVSLDVSCIFADFLISLYICEHSCGKRKEAGSGWPQAQDALGIVSLVFSCLFMAELLASIWAFGLPYFKSKFHCFDAFVIIAGFVVDVCLKGFLEEIGSIVVVLRLWRVFKIIEEFSAGAADQMDILAEQVEHLDLENKELRKELHLLKTNGTNAQEDGSAD